MSVCPLAAAVIFLILTTLKVNNMSYYNEILRQPLAVVRAAQETLLQTPFQDKANAAKQLEAAIVRGDIWFDQIINAVPNHPPGAPGAPMAPVPALANKELDAVKTQTIAMHQGLSSLIPRVDGLTDNVARISTGLDTLVRGLDQIKNDAITRDADLADRLSIVERAARHNQNLDSAEIDAAITAAVAQGFGAFKRKIEKAGLAQAAADSVAVRVIDRKPASDIFGIDITDAHGNPVLVDLWDHPDCPAIDPNFIWTEPVLRHLLLSQTTGENLWFGGAKGAGKTETARQFAARTGRGFTRINFHKYTTADDYLGCTGLQNGNTQFTDGDFLKAYSCPSTVILLDEISNAAPGELAPLNALLEPNTAVTIGGKVRTKAAGVMIIAADNTLTTGDQSGRYAGTQEMNSALADRFARVIQFTHLSMNNEIDAVVRHTGCDPRLAKLIVSTVDVVRQKVNTGEIVDAPSIRQIVAFVRALGVLSIDEAWSTCIGNRQPAESALALLAIRTACLNDKELSKLI
jgi:MoxR-like ATPase